MKILAQLLYYTRYLAVAGALLLGYIAFTVWSASHGGGVPTEDKLTQVTAMVDSITKITETGKRGRKKIYYEFQVTTNENQTEKWKMDNIVSEDSLSDIIKETITAKIDRSSSNQVYGIEMNNKSVLSYTELAASAQRQADEDKAAFANPLMIVLGILILALGLVGMFYERRLRNS